MCLCHIPLLPLHHDDGDDGIRMCNFPHARVHDDGARARVRARAHAHVHGGDGVRDADVLLPQAPQLVFQFALPKRQRLLLSQI